MRRKVIVGRGAGNRPHAQQSEQTQAAHPVKSRVESRAERRRGRTRPPRVRSVGLSGDSAVSSWARESWVGLVKQAGRLGVELETVADRKKLIIRLQREQAQLAGVSNAVWACMTRAERAAWIEWHARNIEDHPVTSIKVLGDAFRKVGLRVERAW